MPNQANAPSEFTQDMHHKQEDKSENDSGTPLNDSAMDTSKHSEH